MVASASRLDTGRATLEDVQLASRLVLALAMILPPGGIRDLR
jgi:hypothetical protein